MQNSKCYSNIAYLELTLCSLAGDRYW